MRHQTYILNEKREVVKATEQEYYEFLKDREKRRVKFEKIGDNEISTVFLCQDHNWSDEGPPILWETMVFGAGPLDQEQDRCSGTWEQAEAMHEAMKQRVAAAQHGK